MKVALPSAVSSGGNGSGWLDSTPWPPLAGGQTRVTITALNPSANRDIRVDATTATAPVLGQTHIAWWSSVDQVFHVRLITNGGGVSGNWELGLDQPLSDSQGNGPAIGDWICPASVGVIEYGKTWRDLMRRLGPGENTADAYRLPRALRHPFISEEWRSDLTLALLKDLLVKHAEITDAEWAYRSQTTPTVPATVSEAPGVLVLRHFGIYQQ
jgi:hypothetical protein